jgi:hypothetical protein
MLTFKEKIARPANLGLIRRDRGARQRWVRTACRPRHRSKKRFELIRYRVFTSLPGFIGLKLSNNFGARMRNSYEVSETERVRTKYNMSESVMVVNFSGLGLGLQSASEIVFGAGQEGVQRCHHLCALADRRSDALHRFCAHIADSK